MTTTLRSLPFEALLRRGASTLAPAVLLGSLLAGALQPAVAQTVDDQLQRLQREVSDLQRQVYGGAAPPAAGAAAGGGGGMAPTQAARLQLQVDQLEVQIQDLTGRVEDMNFRMQSVSDRLDRLVADVDLRLRNLEEGGRMPMAGAAPQGGMMADQPVVGGEVGEPAAPGLQAGVASPPQPGTLGTISETDLDAFQRDQAAEAAQTEFAGQAPAADQTAAVPPAASVLPAGSPQEQYDFAFGLLRQANYAGAEQAFSAFLQQNPNDPLAGNAKYWLGETFYVRGNYQQAAVTFAEGFEAYPNNSKAPDNLLKLGMSLASLGSAQDACGTFDVLLDRYASAPATILSRAQRESQRLGCR